VSLRVLSTLTVPGIWFPDPAAALLSFAHAVFRLTPSPLFLRKVVHPLSDFEPSAETLSGAAHHHHHGEPRYWEASSSHEVLHPSNVQRQANRHCTVPPVRPPSSAFLRLMRVLSSPAPATLFHAAAVPGVPTLQSFSPLLNSAELVTQRFPLGVYPTSPEGN